MNSQLSWIKNYKYTLVLLLSISFIPPTWAVDEINIENADLRVLVELVARKTNRSFIVDPAVRGKVTFVSGKGISDDELYATFLSILQVHGFEAVKVGNITKIVQSSRARQTAVAPIVSDTPAKPRKSTQSQSQSQLRDPNVNFDQYGAYQSNSLRDFNVDETVSKVVKLQYITALTANQTLQPLAGQNETRVQINQASNSLIITGRSQNVARLAALARSIDKPDNNDFEVINLKYAVATQVAQNVQGLLNKGITGDKAAQTRMGVTADERTNSILISGDKAARERLRSMIHRLDLPRQATGGTQIVRLRYANAEEMASILKGVAPSLSAQAAGAVVGAANNPQANSSNLVNIVADRGTNSLVISAPGHLYKNIRRVISQLDVPKRDKGGTVVIPLKYAQAENLVEVLKGVSPGLQKQSAGAVEGAAAAVAKAGDSVSIQADKNSNSIIITAPSFMQANLRRVISQLDQRRAQVLIEAIIAEVSTDLSKRLGVSIGAGADSSGAIGVSNIGGGINEAAALAASNGASVGAGLLFGLGKVLGGEQFGVIVRALKGDAATNILSTPTLVTLDNEEAKIIVGQEVPVITQTQSGGTNTTNPFNTIERKDVGLKLVVTPQINRGKTIRLKIDQEISNLASSSAGAADIITNKRNITTNVMVEDGEVLVLGGLIEDSFRNSKEKVPVLGDLPIIGRAFRGTNTTKLKQNLMVFIHPVILPDAESSNAYTRQKYHTMQQMQKRSKVNGGSHLHSINKVQGTVDVLHNPKPVQRQQRVVRQPVQQKQSQATRVTGPDGTALRLGSGNERQGGACQDAFCLD